MLGSRPRTADESASLLARFVREGARSALAEEWTAHAAHEVRLNGGDPRDRLLVARSLAERVRRQVAYVADEYGRDDPQTLSDTIKRTGGDCEDVAVAFAALALRAGLRVGLAVQVREDGTPFHVVPLVEHPTEARWLPVELTVPRSEFGAWPGPVDRFLVYEVVERGDLGLGFLGSIVSGIVDIVTGNKNAKAVKDAAKANERAAKKNADAVESAAAAQERAVAAQEAARNARTAATLQTVQRIVPVAIGGLAVVTIVPALLAMRRARRR